MQAYSDPNRADSPTALPDIEIFHWPEAVRVEDMHGESHLFESLGDALDLMAEPLQRAGDCGAEQAGGYFWWSCFPGCLPDGDPVGPFETEAEALADAQATD